MEITFQNKLADLKERHEYIVYETKEGKQLGKRVLIARQWFALLILSLLFTLAWGVLGYIGASLKTSTLIVLGSFIVFLILVYSSMFILSLLGLKPYQLVAKSVLEQSEKRLTDEEVRCFQLRKTLDVKDDWLELRDSESQHRWSWQRVESISSTRNFIIIRISSGPDLQIPKRDFSSDQSFIEFEKMLKRAKEESISRVAPIG